MKKIVIFHKRREKGGCGGGWTGRGVRKTTIFRSFRAQKYNILPGLRQSAVLQRSNRGRLGGRGHGNSMKSEAGTFRIHATVPFCLTLRDKALLAKCK